MAYGGKIKRRMAGTLCLGLVCLCASAHRRVYAAGPGTTAANFLKIPVGARETALGGAFTAAVDNSAAVHYNPAGLSLLKTPELSFTYNKYLAGASHQWFAAAYPCGAGTFGLGLNYLGVGAFDSYDSADNRTGLVSAYDLAAYLSYGGRFEPGYAAARSVLYGASVKYIAEKLDTERAGGYGLDLGFIVLPGVKNLKLGLGFDNLAASRIRFINEGARPPFKIKTGVSYGVAPGSWVSQTLFSLDFNFPEDGPRYAAAGVENLLYRTFALRAGYSSFGDISNGLNFGLGVDLAAYAGADFSVDYSFGSSYDFGNIHKLAVTYKLGRPGGADGVSGNPRAAVLPQGLPADKQAVVVSSAVASAVRQAPEVRQGGEASFKLLLGMLSDEDSAIARDGINFLAGLDDPRVIEPFIALLYAENLEVRLAAVSGLARQNDERALNAVEGRLRDTEPEIRRQAAKALGDRGEKRAGTALEAALKDEEEDSVKSAIIAALEKLNRAEQGGRGK